jgi:hypothetical protein
MGGTTFANEVHTPHVEKAFFQAKDENSWDRGHGGYTGTIAEKDGYVVITRTPMSPAAAAQLAEQLFEQEDSRIDDKWGPAGAIPLTLETNGGRKIEVTTTVSGNVSFDQLHVLARKAAEAKLKPTEQIVDVRPKQECSYRVTQEATKGKTVTRYVIVGDRRAASWEKGYPTQAEARAAAVARAKAMGDHQNLFDQGESLLEVVAVTRRENGDPLVRIKREVVKTTITATVTVEPKPTGNVKIDGWYFFGWASS